MTADVAPVRSGLYIGLISGTSMDGIDAALVAIDDQAQSMSTVAELTSPYPAALRQRLLEAIEPHCRLSLHDYASLDIELGRAFAAAATQVLDRAGVAASAVAAIGSHGQTLRHSPHTEPPYTLQIANAATIAARCGITTVADFRGIDIAYGGEGAPLVPPFHEWRFRSRAEDRVVLNIGGIANVSVLPAQPNRALLGYDTGPGNCLMDVWCAAHLGAAFDVDGAWAASGRVSAALLASFLGEDYFARSPPKSTGRETFDRGWIDRHLESTGLAALPPQDVQATLAALTVESIARAIERFGDCPAQVIVCGGGARNTTLMAALASRLPRSRITTTASFGLTPDMVEASTFAWLAHMRLHERPVRLTTARQARALLLGAVYRPAPALTA